MKDIKWKWKYLFIVIPLILVISVVVYANDYYRAMPEAKAMLISNDKIEYNGSTWMECRRIPSGFLLKVEIIHNAVGTVFKRVTMKPLSQENNSRILYPRK